MCNCNDNFIPIPTGINGKDGDFGGYSGKWLFSNYNNNAPGSKYLAFDNTLVTSITKIFINKNNADNLDFTSFITSLNFGDGALIRIFKEHDPTTYMILGYFGVNTISGNIFSLTVSYFASNGTFSLNDNLVFTFNSKGNKGADSLPFTATTSFTFNQNTNSPGDIVNFTITPANTNFNIGNSIRLSNTSNVSQYLDGIISSYNKTTGAISIITEGSIGGGWIATNFSVMLTGRRGQGGIDGQDSQNIIGMIVDYPVDTVPSGWLPCDGRQVSRTALSSLFNIIGTRFGVGDGSTTFNLPDLRRRVRVGFDSTSTTTINPAIGEENYAIIGNKGGVNTNTLSKGNIPSHSHKIETTPGAEGGGISVTNITTNSLTRIDSTVNVSSGSGNDVADTWSVPPIGVTTTITGNTGNGALDGLKTSPDPIENRPKYIVLYPIIKVL